MQTEAATRQTGTQELEAEKAELRRQLQQCESEAATRQTEMRLFRSRTQELEAEKAVLRRQLQQCESARHHEQRARLNAEGALANLRASRDLPHGRALRDLLAET
jgi:chromosome segregation ATPase